MSYNTLKVLFEVHLWTRFDMVENSCASVHGRLTQELGLQSRVRAGARIGADGDKSVVSPLPTQ